MGKRIVQNPYLFCSQCNKLAPMKLAKLTDLMDIEHEIGECYVCGELAEAGSKNRVVWLTKEEAVIRGLQALLKRK